MSSHSVSAGNRAVAHDPETVLAAISDPRSRAVIAATAEGPRSVADIVDDCEMSTATAYRKVNQLVEAGLLSEDVRVHPDSTNVREFALRAEAIHVTLSQEGVSSVTISERTAEEPAQAPPVSTDGGSKSERPDGDTDRLQQLFVDVTNTERVVEPQDSSIESRYLDERDSVSGYVTEVGRDDGLGDALSEPDETVGGAPRR